MEEFEPTLANVMMVGELEDYELREVGDVLCSTSSFKKAIAFRNRSEKAKEYYREKKTSNRSFEREDAKTSAI